MKFSYSAYDRDGKLVSGTLEGVDERDIVAQLNQSGLHIFQATPATEKGRFAEILRSDIGRKKASLAHRAQFSRSLHALVAARVPIDRALFILSNGKQGRWIAKVAKNAHEAIISGSSLSDALSASSAGFSPDEAGLVSAGEQTATITDSLDELSGLLENRLQMRQRIISALVYPSILIVMALVSLAIIATVLIPAVAPLLTQSGVELPLMFRFLIAAQTLFQEHAGESLTGLLLVLVLITVMAVSQNSVPYSHIMLTSRLGKDMEAARIFRTLGSLLKNKVPVQRAVQLTAAAVKSKPVATDLHKAAEAVMTGKSLVKALSHVRVIDESASALVAVGEETNQVPELLLHLAKRTETDVGHRIDRFLTILTPALTIGLGLLIGGLIVSVMRAIMSINDVAGAL